MKREATRYTCSSFGKSSAPDYFKKPFSKPDNHIVFNYLGRSHFLSYSRSLYAPPFLLVEIFLIYLQSLQLIRLFWMVSVIKIFSHLEHLFPISTSNRTIHHCFPHCLFFFLHPFASFYISSVVALDFFLSSSFSLILSCLMRPKLQL